LIHLQDGRLSWHKTDVQCWNQLIYRRLFGAHYPTLHPTTQLQGFRGGRHRHCTQHTAADILTLVHLSTQSAAFMFWQTVQGDSQSALVIGKSCSKAPQHSIRSKSCRNWSKSYSSHVIFGCSLYQWRHRYQATAQVCHIVCFVSTVKMIKVHFFATISQNLFKIGSS